MEYLPLLIGVIIAIAAAIGGKKKTTDGGSSTEGHGENFPFPKELREMFGLDDEESPLPEPTYVSVEQQESSVEYDRFGEEGVAMTVADKIKANEGRYQQTIVADAPMEIDRSRGGEGGATNRNFDLRQAVIYAEILKPKYNDNLL